MLRGHDLDVSLPCKLCNDFAIGICASCGSWTCDRDRIRMHDEYWCCLCYQGFQHGATPASSASQSSGLAANPDGGRWRPSERDPQCSDCSGPVTDCLPGVVCAQCGVSVHKWCFKTHWDRCRLDTGGRSDNQSAISASNELCCRVGPHVSLPCKLCSAFATLACHHCGTWNCDNHIFSTEGMREGYMFDEPCCQLCCGGFQGGLSWVASARQAHSHETNSHGGIRQLSVQRLQCLSCRGPIVHKADGVSCAQCAEAVHRRCLETHWERCRHCTAANRESIWQRDHEKLSHDERLSPTIVHSFVARPVSDCCM